MGGEEGGAAHNITRGRGLGTLGHRGLLGPGVRGRGRGLHQGPGRDGILVSRDNRGLRLQLDMDSQLND